MVGYNRGEDMSELGMPERGWHEPSQLYRSATNIITVEKTEKQKSMLVSQSVACVCENLYTNQTEDCTLMYCPRCGSDML